MTETPPGQRSGGRQHRSPERGAHRHGYRAGDPKKRRVPPDLEQGAPRIARAFKAAGIAGVSRQQERLLAEVAALRDEVRMQSAATNRLDMMMGQMLKIQTGILEQMRAMVAQHQRFAERLSRLDRDRRGWL